ncbi:MAG: hypothetical protein LBI05_01540 [Planctomycetaceae bacterium]|jgi:hypothetical protein|nr:hypothetical protein [Planctomycetaceae bacterium]
MGSVRKGREIDSALCKKGFRRETGGDHICYFLMDRSGDDTDIKTKVSHGAMGITVGVNLISRMARQLRLTKMQFLALIDCTLDEEGYRQILQNEEE